MSAVLVLQYQTPGKVAVTITPPAGTPTYSYQLKRAPDSGGTPGSFANLGSAVPGQTGAYTLTDATAGAQTRYWYQVVVTDSAGTPVVTTSNNVSAFAGKYAFSGLGPYVAAAAGNHSAVTAALVPKALALPALRTVQSLLGQAVEQTGQAALTPQSAQVLKAVAWVEVLRLGADACERAVLDVCTYTGVTPPSFAKNTNEG
jgi:hypothetical protein